jgi:coenzyme PQQ biosynthesis protein PqqD
MNGAAIPRIPRGVRLREDKVRGRWVLLAPERIFEIDGIGAEILKRCDGKANLSAIAADLAKVYGADIAEVEPDVVAFVKGFAEKRIIDV